MTVHAPTEPMWGASWSCHGCDNATAAASLASAATTATTNFAETER